MGKFPRASPNGQAPLGHRAVETAKMPEQDQLLSAFGVDYTQLRDLLATEQWQKADEETGTIMLRIARRVTPGWLREEDIQEFPCLDLQAIDQLWVKHSNDHFGFSVQNRIWQEAGEDYNKFSDRVGWRLYGNWQRWRQYSDLIFSLHAPEGHLPAAPFLGHNGLLIGWASSLKLKLANC